MKKQNNLIYLVMKINPNLHKKQGKRRSRKIYVKSVGINL
jgi:hypothetical protein